MPNETLRKEVAWRFLLDLPAASQCAIRFQALQFLISTTPFPVGVTLIWLAPTSSRKKKECEWPIRRNRIRMRKLMSEIDVRADTMPQHIGLLDSTS